MDTCTATAMSVVVLDDEETRAALIGVAKSEVVTDCVCPTEVHEAGKLNAEWWARQRLIGLQPLDEETCLEMKNCTSPGCESTLAVVVPMTAERVVLIEESMRRARETAQLIAAQVDRARVRRLA